MPSSTRCDLLPMRFFSNSAPHAIGISNCVALSASWQPQLRTLFMMRIASWKYRLQVPGFEFPRTFGVRQAAYDEQSARILEEMADCIERGHLVIARGPGDSAELLKATIEEAVAEVPRGLPDGRAQSFVTLMRGIDGLTKSLASDIAAELGGPVERC